MDNRRPPYAAPPPPPSSVDSRAPPPPPIYPQYHQQPPPPPPQQQQHPSSLPPQAPPHHYAQYPPPPPPPNAHPAGPALPPISQHYRPPGSAPDQTSLPPVSQTLHHPPPHEARDAQEYHPYSQQPNRSGHATPAPVNRSYSHDSLQQRTPTTPAQPGPYPPLPAHDGAHPPPPPMDHGHPGYPPVNGVPHHGLPPPQSGGPMHHEQHPHYITSSAESHQYPPPQQPQQMYAQNPYGPTSASMYQVSRKKQMRATQACEQCRQRKQKCDEGNPCSFCKENSLQCQYRDTPPAKTDKNMERLLSMMEQQTHGLQQLTAKVESLDAKVRRFEHPNRDDPDALRNSDASHKSSERPDDWKTQQEKAELDDHRTAPHKLFGLWPSVNRLLVASDIKLSDNYVMEVEDRGILRLYTRGEGVDEHDGTQPGPASPARSDESGAESNAPTPSEIWGYGLPQTPSSDIRRSEPHSWGGLKPDNSLDLDSTTVNALYESYIQNIHPLHPFLDHGRLRHLVNTFIKRYSPDKKFARTFAVAQNGSDTERPLKRQRSNGLGTNSTSAPGTDGHSFKSPPTERSPGNAVVYLVLALGKICMHKESLPGIVQDNKLTANNRVIRDLTFSDGVAGSSPISATIKPSPMSPKSTPTTHPTPPTESGAGQYSRSRRSSMDGSNSGSTARNLDVLPGLAYYAAASEILGDQGDGNDLVHAQMFLLAGLYKGQLARPKESIRWFAMAGGVCRVLLDRYKLYNEKYWTAEGDYKEVRDRFTKGQNLNKDKRSNLIILASWTCLQLESDILAELRLPHSGISRIENFLLLPNRIPEDDSFGGLDTRGEDNTDNLLIFYTAQLFLRKRLNLMHKEIYGPDCLNQSHEAVRMILVGHNQMLESWRKTLPPMLQWNDGEQPPSDILSARLRAKYWGARYIAHRPFLDYIMHIYTHIKSGMTMEECAIDASGNPRDAAELHLFRAISGMPDKDIFQAARRCVEAAMHSTEAFDRIADRLIVTNIHGTAHAQFGNMLVLSATYHQKYLREFVQADRLQPLIARTIAFLRRLVPISATCQFDCMVLEKINNALFGVAPKDKHVYDGEGTEYLITDAPISASNSFSAST